MFKDELGALGLAQNESLVYVTLVRHGGMGVSAIAEKSGVNRRNVYDTLNRLLEKGLAYEEVASKETLYFAVDPVKLREIVSEKSQKLESVMPELEKLFKTRESTEAVYIYKGIEGWKNYLRDMVNTGETVRIYGAAGASLDPKAQSYFDQMKQKLNQKGIEVRVLYQQKAVEKSKTMVGHFGPISKNRILPDDLGEKSSFGVFGGLTYVVSRNYSPEALDNEVKMIVIRDKNCAEMYKELFDLAWTRSQEA